MRLLRALVLLLLLWPGAGWADPVRTGSPASFTSSANSGSTIITIPSDATMVVIAVSGFSSTANFFSTGTFTLNSVAFSAVVAADGNTGDFEGAMFYWFNPATGSQTVAWDWVGAGAPSDGVLFMWAAYKDLDTTGIRSSSGSQQAGNPHTSGTLTALPGDLIVAAVETFGGAELTYTWTNATKISDFTVFASADGSWAEASPTGNQTVSADASVNNDGGIMAIVLKPAAAGAPQRSMTGVGL